MEVELIERMGSDLSIVNAARVSFDKESEWEEYELPACEQLCDNPFCQERWCIRDGAVDYRLSERDQKLIHYLAKNGHWSPFAHAFLSFRIKAPIFVARQLAKHQVGLAWNEVSRRYVDSEPEFYVPKAWRKRAPNVKQGSLEETITHLPLAEGEEDLWGPFDVNGHIKTHIDYHNHACLGLYNELLKAGICPEQARMVLPQSMMTEWIWSGSLYAFARVCKLRLDSHAQKETQEVAEKIAKVCSEEFPVSWKALVDGQEQVVSDNRAA